VAQGGEHIGQGLRPGVCISGAPVATTGMPALLAASRIQRRRQASSGPEAGRPPARRTGKRPASQRASAASASIPAIGRIRGQQQGQAAGQAACQIAALQVIAPFAAARRPVLMRLERRP
jgi:hypothetical protein